MTVEISSTHYDHATKEERRERRGDDYKRLTALSISNTIPTTGLIPPAFVFDEMTIATSAILQISTILVSFAVVSAPILYPRYSLYVRRANTGLQRLDHLQKASDDVRLGSVEKGEQGFKELLEAIEVVFGDVGEVERICFAVGSPPDLGEFTGFGMEYGVGDNGVLYVEGDDDSRELLRWKPWSPTTSLEKEKLERGISVRAQERSHFITMALAVL